jgi:RP/EB family microtubule-associated protein
MQWFKAFFDQTGGPNNLEHYDAREVRARGKGGDKYNAQFGSGGGGTATRLAAGRASLPSRSAVPGSATASKGRVPSHPASAPPASKASVVSGNPSSPRQHRPLRERPEQPTAKTGSTTTVKGAAVDPEQQSTRVADLEAQVQGLQQKVEDLEVAVMDVEKERDFYFEKLRNVEVLLQVHQEQGSSPDASVDSANNAAVPAELVDKIFKVLYASPEDEVIVTNDGELIAADQILSQELSSTVL